ncbi:DNA binding domain-containing protein, excisionase family [Ornithinimicrobium cerasi]|uniref:DNA binding domain-containing protein, excisionase family n=2 Tax=Ornithinimicrobium cerasi TaxID=2248773 RepID=A0A285VVA6_9MICO|nr:DNA binding domain-containing protein, excisionase family [Ornithinimicrobium cerasi]
MTVEHSQRRSGWPAVQAATRGSAPTDGLGAGHADPMFLTVQEVAELLRVSPATVRAWIAKGEGPPAMRFGKQIRYRPERVMEWVEQQEEGRG